MTKNVVLDGPPPWGFRLSGGRDFTQPLCLSRVTPNSKASLAKLRAGDLVVAIGGVPTGEMTHAEAQNRIKVAGHQLSLTIKQPETRLWSPHVIQDDGQPSPFKINLEAEPQEHKPVGTGHNVRAQPFVAAANIDDKRQVVSAAYNSPIGLYSTGNITDALCGQMRGLVPDKPECKKLKSIEESHVYRMLQEKEEGPQEPRQSGSFKALQGIVESDDALPILTRKVKAPVTKLTTPTGTLQKLPICDKCGNGIVGTVVKVRESYRHPGCFVCSDCDVSLKQKGYFFVGGKLYCETHARARMKPPEGHDVVATYPSA